MFRRLREVPFKADQIVVDEQNKRDGWSEALYLGDFPFLYLKEKMPTMIFEAFRSRSQSPSPSPSPSQPAKLTCVWEKRHAILESNDDGSEGLFHPHRDFRKGQNDILITGDDGVVTRCQHEERFCPHYLKKR